MSINMLLFYFGCALFVGVLSYAVFKGWFLYKPQNSTTERDRYISTLKVRLNELQADLSSGRIDELEFQALTLQIEKQILSDDARHRNVASLDEKTTAGWAFIPLVLMLVFGFYTLNVLVLTRADHAALWQYWHANDAYGEEADKLLQGQLAQFSEGAKENPAAFIQAVQTNVYQHGFDASRWLALSKLYALVNAPTDAMSAAEHAHRLAPNDDAIALMDAKLRLLVQHGKMDETTAQMILSVLSRHPNSADALSLLAMGELGNHHFDKAKDILLHIKNQWLKETDAPNRAEALIQLEQAITMVEETQLKAQQAQSAATMNTQH